jgi:hypothetical protein
MSDPIRDLDFGVIGDRIRNALTAVVNLLDRDFPAQHQVPGFQPFLLLTSRATKATYEALMYLCSDKPADPWRKPEFAVAALPLVRTIADALANVAFAFADPEAHVRWYWASGWREYKENLERIRKRSTAQTAWLREQEQALQMAVQRWQLPSQWVADPRRNIPWWPTMGRLARECLYPDLRLFFEHLNLWLYKLLSSASHSTPPGLRVAGVPLLRDEGPEQDEELARLKSDAVFTAVTLVLAFLSEVRAHLRLNVGDLPFLWTTVLQYWPPAKELYELRYRQALASVES